MKVIKTERKLYTHAELETMLNIGRNIINERAKNKKDGNLNVYNKYGGLWRRGDGIKHFDIDEVKNELSEKPYRKNMPENDSVIFSDREILIRIMNAVETLAKAWK